MNDRQKMGGGLAILTAFALALAGCVSATPYQPDIPGQRVSGGYSETQLADNRFRVSFSGNCLTSRDRVEGYLMYRAAELTLEQGYDWFLILDRLTEREARTYVHPDPLYRPWFGSEYVYWRPHWRYYREGLGWRTWHPERGDPFWTERVRVSTIEEFEAHAEITTHTGPAPADEERAFDARRVIADLEPSIERPAGGGGGMC